MSTDVPSPIDLRVMADALAWEASAMEKRPWRSEFFAAMATALKDCSESVLELGSGPGFLAEYLLARIPASRYVMLDFSASMHELARRRPGAEVARVGLTTCPSSCAKAVWFSSTRPDTQSTYPMEVPLPFDPSETYVRLTGGGSAELIAGGEAFWSLPEPQLDHLSDDWLITEFECASDWSNWEMHPEAEEFVYLLSGAAVLLLEQPAGVQEVPLLGRAAVVVPKGIWHTAKVSQPSRMLFVTKGRGTQHRAAD